jgi:hypothetical protein
MAEMGGRAGWLCYQAKPSQANPTPPRAPANYDNLTGSLHYQLQFRKKPPNMNAQRLGLRLGRTLRSPNVRTTVQRRFESSADKLPQPGKKLVGPQDNAFNRERAAVKAHAAATSGVFKGLKIN